MMQIVRTFETSFLSNPSYLILSYFISLPFNFSLQLRVQQSALKAGEVHYSARADDIRVLKIKIKVG